MAGHPEPVHKLVLADKGSEGGIYAVCPDAGHRRLADQRNKEKAVDKAGEHTGIFCPLLLHLGPLLPEVELFMDYGLILSLGMFHYIFPHISDMRLSLFFTSSRTFRQ